MTETNEVLTNEFEAPEAVTETEGTDQVYGSNDGLVKVLIYGAGVATGVLLKPAVKFVKKTWKDFKNHRAIKKAEKKAKKTVNEVKEHLDDITEE